MAHRVRRAAGAASTHQKITVEVHIDGSTLRRSQSKLHEPSADNVKFIQADYDQLREIERYRRTIFQHLQTDNEARSFDDKSPSPKLERRLTQKSKSDLQKSNRSLLRDSLGLLDLLKAQKDKCKETENKLTEEIEDRKYYQERHRMELRRNMRLENELKSKVQLFNETESIRNRLQTDVQDLDVNLTEALVDLEEAKALNARLLEELGALEHARLDAASVYQQPNPQTLTPVNKSTFLIDESSWTQPKPKSAMRKKKKQRLITEDQKLQRELKRRIAIQALSRAYWN